MLRTFTPFWLFGFHNLDLIFIGPTSKHPNIPTLRDSARRPHSFVSGAHASPVSIPHIPLYRCLSALSRAELTHLAHRERLSTPAQLTCRRRLDSRRHRLDSRRRRLDSRRRRLDRHRSAIEIDSSSFGPAQLDCRWWMQRPLASVCAAHSGRVSTDSAPQ